MSDRVERSRLCWYGDVKRMGKGGITHEDGGNGAGWKKTIRTTNRVKKSLWKEEDTDGSSLRRKRGRRIGRDRVVL